VLVELAHKCPDAGDPPEGGLHRGSFVRQDVASQPNESVLNLHLDCMGMPHYVPQFGAHALAQHVIGGWSALCARPPLSDDAHRTPLEVCALAYSCTIRAAQQSGSTARERSAPTSAFIGIEQVHHGSA
jgi:hypothetical protein